MRHSRFAGLAFLIAVALALVLLSTFALGQGIVTGAITGTVQDQQGAVVAGAKITARHLETNREFTTDSNSVGLFALRNLPSGAYVVVVEAPNFRKFEAKDVLVVVGRDTPLGNVQMTVGNASETLTIEAGAPPLVQTEASQAGETFTTQQTANLPIGNGFDQLALFTPGVVPSGSNGFSNNNGADINVNGQRGRSNNFQLDGQQNNDNSVAGPAIFFGNQDAISEVQILTNYSAEYGRNSGSVVNYITKSGTNNFHGTGYEVYDGNWADSLTNLEKSPLLGFCRPDQATTTGCTNPAVPQYVDNRFGGTIGGPVAKDKMWFFGSANIERFRGGGASNPSGTSITPTPTGLQQLQAAFPGNAGVALLSAIGPASVTNGRLTFTPFDCNSLTIVPASCNPDGTFTVNDGVTSAPVEFGTVNRFLSPLFNDWEASGRFDWQVTSKDHFFSRYIFQQQINTDITANTTAEVAAGNFVDVPSRAQQIGLDWVRTFSPTILNQLRYSYSRTNVGFEGGGFPNCTRASLPNDCPTRVSFNDSRTLNLGLTTSFPQGRRVLVSTVQDNATWQKGRHTFKFGGDFTRQDSPNVFLPTIGGSFAYPGDPQVGGGTIPVSAFNHFLADSGATTSVTDGDPHIPFKENDLAFYAQDEWRVSDSLTLNLGIRWEWFQQAINLLHDRSVAQQTGSNPFWDTSLPQSLTTVPRIPEDRNNFSPVVGFSWKPRLIGGRQDSTVVRGGFRISYDPSFYNILLNVATSTPSVNLATNLPCNGCLPASGSQVDARANLLPLVPLGVNPGVRTQTQVSKDFHNPYVLQWNFGVQHEFSPRVVTELRYVGNHAIGLFQSVNGNPGVQPLIDAGFSNVLPAGVAPCSTAGAPGFSAAFGYIDCDHRRVTIRQNSAFSIYHGLQSRFEIRGWHGVVSGVTYTWSKNIDNVSEIFSTISGGNSVSFAQNPFDVGKGERSLSGIDYPQVATIYLMYELPWYKSQHGLVGKLLGGYQINPTWRYTSGQPWTPIQSVIEGSNLCDGSNTFSTFYTPCRPFVSNMSAPYDMVGQCTDPGSADCGLIDFNTGNPIAAKAVRWIVNDATSAQFFGTPWGTARRNMVRGMTINNASLALIKKTKLGERFDLEVRAIAFNVFNRYFMGVPDPLIVSGNAEVGSSFGNFNFNDNGGDSANATQSGIGRRRIEVGAKIIF